MGAERVGVLNGIDLDIIEGEFLVIQGPAGSGKSALLNIMAGIEESSSGSVDFMGSPVNKADVGKTVISSLVTFLSPVFSLDVTLTIQEAIRQPGMVAQVDPELAMELAGLRALDNRPIKELDHETRRRVGTAIAFLSRPRVILADMSPPPWGVAPPLDSLEDANEELGCAVVITTTVEISVAGSRQLELANGRLKSPRKNRLAL